MWYNRSKDVIIMRILIIEDEKSLSMVLSEMLTLEGYNTDTAYDGEEGLDNALTGIYDVIILDVMLPKLDGFQVLKKIRENNINTAVIMLTAKAELEDKVSGLDFGADDYLTKPFHMKELLARIRALGRRKEKDYTQECLFFSDIMLDRTKHEVHKENNRIRLSKKEFEILELLILHPGQLISKEQLIVKIWGFDSDIEYNSIEVYISFLRKKLSAIGSFAKISTSRGLGYTIEDKCNG